MELRLSARRAVSNLSDAVAEKDAALRRSELMAREVDHRVKNSLQLISGLLRLQQTALGATEASSQLALAANRVAAVARVHQHLYAGDGDGEIDCRSYFQRLCDDLSGTLGGEQAAIHVEVADAALPTVKMVPLGLILAELVANAAKHGAGSINVTLERSTVGGYALSVTDEGAGLPPEYDPTQTSGLGMRVISALVGQLHGRLSFGDDAGKRATITVWFPERD